MIKLKKFLNDKDITIYKMSKDLGKSPSYFYKMINERNPLNISLLTAIEISDYLDINLDELAELLRS